MKITIKTLPQASAQEVFDYVAKHLLAQKKRAYVAGRGCSYKVSVIGSVDTVGAYSPVLSCAAGCLMADDEYNSLWEGRSWGDLVSEGEVPFNHAGLICDLQHLHDVIPVSSWLNRLEDLANKKGLNTNNLPLGELV